MLLTSQGLQGRDGIVTKPHPRIQVFQLASHRQIFYQLTMMLSKIIFEILFTAYTFRRSCS